MLEQVIVSLFRPSAPRLSPDGRWVAYATMGYGQDEDHPEGNIWLAAADGSGPARQFTFGPGRDWHPRWSPDSRSLAFLSDRAERGVGAIYLISADGGEARSIVKRKRGIGAFAWSPDGARLAFLAPDEPTDEDERRRKERDDPEVYGEDWKLNRLHLVDVSSGGTSPIPVGEVHVTEIAWSPDGKEIAYLAGPTPELETQGQNELRVVSVQDGESRHVCKSPGWGMHELGWSNDGTSLLFSSTHEPLPQASATCYVVNADGGTPRVVGSQVDEDACSFGIRAVPGEARTRITVAHALSTRLEWTDAEAGERTVLYAPPEGDLGESDCCVVDGTLHLAAIRSGGNQPPEVFVGTNGSLQQVSDHHAALRDYTFGTQEAFHWTAPDGLPIDGILIRPANASSDRLPLVTLVHGGPYGRSADGWNLTPLSWAQWLAHHGYAVLMPNYRGGMGHGNRFAAAARGNVGAGGDFSDVMAGVDAAIERGIADPDRLGIGGWSQGGFMTAWAVTQTERFKCGVMGAGVSDWGMMAMTSDVPTFESVLGGDRPWDGTGPHRFAELSPISFAKNATTPLLILHGKNDERVPVTQAIGFQRALREKGVEVKMVVYPREPHGVRERNHQIDILRRVRDWYDRWLKA